MDWPIKLYKLSYWFWIINLLKIKIGWGTDMGVIPTSKLESGMVLAVEVKDVSGRLLLAKGEELQPAHIRVLKMWGVSEVNIVGDVETKDKAEADIDPDVWEKTKNQTALIFRHVDLDHPALNVLFDLCVLFRCKHNGLVTESDIKPEEYDDSKNHIKREILKKINDRQIQLPEIPSIVFELNEVIEDPMASSENIAEVVNKSPSLTANLLRIVNSPLYGFPNKIDKVSRAVTLIGTKEISSLALGIMMLTVFKNIPPDILNMHSFLKHSLACGVISRILAAKKNLKETEQLLVAGLLHDIGRLVIYAYFPELARKLLSRALVSDQILHREEQSYLGCQHTDVAKYLLQKWKLPSNIENNVVQHHNPSTAENHEQATIIHLADIIVNGLGFGTSGARLVPPLDTESWDNLKLSPNCFESVIEQATHQLFALEIFLQGLETK
jgi:putative nucleotidyltransferase with HDIG domain